MAAVAVSIATAAAWLVPGMGFQTAIVLGAVVAPPDTISAVSIFRRLGLPRRLTSIIVGENLVNDATSLTLYRLTVATAAGTSTLFSQPVAMLGYGAAIGAIICARRSTRTTELPATGKRATAGLGMIVA